MNRRIVEDFRHLIRMVEGLFEIAALTYVYSIFRDLLYQSRGILGFIDGQQTIDLCVYAVLLLVVFELSDSMKFGQLKFTEILVSQVISAVLANLIEYFRSCMLTGRMISLLPILLVFLTDILICFGCSYLYTWIYHKVFVPYDILMIYETEDGLDLKFKMDQRRDRYKITEVISIESGLPDIFAAIAHHDAVVINDIDGNARSEILKYCYSRGVRTYLAPKITDTIIEGGENIFLFDTPLKLIKGCGLSLPQRTAKRTMDIVLSVFGLVLLSPLMLITAIAIKKEDGGSVFFKQKRVTRDGKVFEILKFRSMVMNAEKGSYDLNMRARGNDSRITKVGRIIRAYRIDEIPQLLNILKGEMSIVGPRPERVENVEAYAKDIPEWHLREKVKGGLTGFAQVFGRYNTSPLDKTKLDIMYIERYSLFLDIKLIIMTLRILLTPESTEGFEAVEDMRKMREKLIKEIKEDRLASEPGKGSTEKSA